MRLLFFIFYSSFFFSSRRRHTRFKCDWTSDECFFFSSRRRHTRFKCDWSSDVCSSDLMIRRPPRSTLFPHVVPQRPLRPPAGAPHSGRSSSQRADALTRSRGERATRNSRSEERRVGKGVDLGGRRIIKKKKTEQLDERN